MSSLKSVGLGAPSMPMGVGSSARVASARPVPTLGGDRVAVSAEALAATVIAAWRALPGMAGTSEVVAYQDGKTLRSQTIAAHYRAPGQVQLHVLDGYKKGSRLGWDGGAKVHVKGVPFDLDVCNGRLCNPHGWSLRDTAPGMVFRMLEAPGTKVRYGTPENGLPVLEVTSPASPKGVTRETLVIDPVNKIVVERRLYNGDDLLGRSTVKDFTPGLPTGEP